jgi:MFS transporter, OFA family, oxalate/formate antiporter
MQSPARVPARAWIVTFAGMAVNLCLGILYAWSVWKAKLTPKGIVPGTPMTGLDEGWTVLTGSEATWAYAICGFTFALCMIPGGRLQDRFGPKIGTTLGGLSLAAGCILAGLMKSFVGLILGFGVLGGIGMGLAYAATTPAAVKWFGPQWRGLIVGLVVAGFGAAALYIAPLGNYLIREYGLSGSFIGLGLFFAVVIVGAGLLMSFPPADYVPPHPPATSAASSIGRVDWKPGEMLRTPQFFGLVFLFLGSAQSGLLVIANAQRLPSFGSGAIADFASQAVLLASIGAVVNAAGRIGTGFLSDRIGRANAYLVNGVLSAVCLFAMPMILRSESVPLLFLAVMVAYWQYGGGLSLLPAWTADYFGPKNLGVNYGLVFLGWGMAFFVPQIAAYLEDSRGTLDDAFLISGGLMIAAIVVCLLLRRPTKSEPAAV